MWRIGVHASALLVPVVSEIVSKSVVMVALTVVALLYVLSEAMRLKGRQVPLMTRFTMRMRNDNEGAHFIVSPICLAVGVILSLLLFPTNIAYASICVVAVGDPVAYYAGERFGRVPVGRKTLEGFAAGLVASFLIASLWVRPSLSLVGSFSGMLLELAGILNDNLTVPIGAGSMMLLASIM
jgi:dolichol kinase